MRSNDLNAKWIQLESLPREGDYDVVRLSAECVPEVSLAISPESNRCLVLRLPPEFEFDFREIEREKLSLTKVYERNLLAVTLLDTEFSALFDDLILSIHKAVRHLTRADEYYSEFIQTFNKWSQFFERGDSDRLPENTIRGLFGELVFLRSELTRSSASEVNMVLNAWRGPYDQGHDFIFEDRNVEVKTRSNLNASVKIANENQLDQLEGKGLHLAVVEISSDIQNGLSLEELTRSVANVVQDRLGDASIIYDTLRQKNLSPLNLRDYDNLRFSPVAINLYDCLAEYFPRVVRSELPDAVFALNYSLNTDEIEEYMLERIKL
jgi:hypothetical protein